MNEDKSQRLDAALVSRALVSGREKAKSLIAGGFVQVNGVVVTKPTKTVSETDEIVCDSSSLKYVGRGGFKLEKAIEVAKLDLDGCVAMDVGASTGGFTDCMLQNGAAHVFAIDVGHDQLHPSLLADTRVTSLEGTDIRNTEKITPCIAPESIDFCSVDLSFISLTQVIPSILPLLRPTATLVCLIKPQFEVGKADVKKHGVVRDIHAHRRLLEQFLLHFSNWQLTLRQLMVSPITGGEGNVEYLAVLDKQSNTCVRTPDINALLNDTKMMLKSQKR